MTQAEDKERAHCERVAEEMIGSTYTYHHVDSIMRLRAAARADIADALVVALVRVASYNQLQRKHDALVAAARDVSKHWDGDYHAGVKAIAALRALIENKNE